MATFSWELALRGANFPRFFPSVWCGYLLFGLGPRRLIVVMTRIFLRSTPTSFHCVPHRTNLVFTTSSLLFLKRLEKIFPFLRSKHILHQPIKSSCEQILSFGFSSRYLSILPSLVLSLEISRFLLVQYLYHVQHVELQRCLSHWTCINFLLCPEP